MSQDPIDQWLESLRFEIYRLQFRPGPMQPNNVLVLRSQIDKLKSQQVATLSGKTLETTLHRIDALEQDLASFEQIIRMVAKLDDTRKLVRKSGATDLTARDDMLEAVGDYTAWFEKKTIGQRESQRRNLASLRLFWPKADWSRRKLMVGLFATYGMRRFASGAKNISLQWPLKVALSLIKRS